MFKLDDVELEFSNEALNLIAEKAIIRKTGARGLRTIVENLLKDTMFEVPSDDNIKQVVIGIQEKDGKKELKIEKILKNN